jgi:tetratricopeptide (TPR) repeat protein
MLILTVVAGFYAYRAEIADRQRCADQERHEEELQTEKRQAAIEKAQLAAIGCQFDEAEQALRDAERLGASAGQVRMLRGWIDCFSDRTTEAVGDLEQAVNLLPQSVAARAMLSFAYGRIGEWEKANQALREMEELSPQSPEDFLFEGNAWQHIDPVKGLRILDEAVRRRPSLLARVFRAEALASLAQETGTVADAERAVQEAEVAKQLLPGNPLPTIYALWARILAASAYAAAGDQEKRAKRLSEARADADTLKGMQRSPGAMVWRCRFFEYVGEQDAIVEEMRSALGSRDPVVRKTAVYFCSLYLFERGNSREALAIMDASRASQIEAMRPFVLAELPGGKPLAIEACKDMAKKDWYGWEWAYGQSALSAFGQSEDLAAAAGDFQRRTKRFPFAEKDAQLFRKLLAYWAGEAPGQALLDAAEGSRRNLCRAHYFLGISKLGHGEREAACKEFRAAVAAVPVYLWTRHMSKVMLSRLEKDSAWPPWLPVKKRGER